MGLADLTGKVALVTGGGSGIGAGIGRVLAECGARVAVADVNAETAESFARSLAADFGSEAARPFTFDVSDRSEVDRGVGEVVKEFGAIDILVNNAGVHAAPGWVDAGRQFREEDWDVTFRINVKGTVLVTEAVMPGMIGRRAGKIVNLSSQAGRGEWPTGGGLLAAASGGAYGASKAAVIQVTQTYAVRLGPHSINVNCVCPGSIYTPFWAQHAVWATRNFPAFKDLAPEQVYEKAILERCPLGRPQTVEDVGHAVAFFVSEYAKNITGQSLNVNGGQRMN